jgi:hypothetical protein
MHAELAQLPSKVSLTALGLEIHGPLTKEEWREIGLRIGGALTSIAFVIGDWLVYGEGRDAQLTFWAEIPESDKVPGPVYAEAARLTGLDVTTLQNYAYVSRRVPRSLRNEHVSWEHHKKVAKLREPAEQTRWLKLAADMRLGGQPIGVRRLARSIEAGRLLTLEELEADDDDTGIENVHPHVNRIVSFFGRLKNTGWLATADRLRRITLKRDLQPVIDIYNQL